MHNQNRNVVFGSVQFTFFIYFFFILKSNLKQIHIDSKIDFTYLCDVCIFFMEMVASYVQIIANQLRLRLNNE